MSTNLQVFSKNNFTARTITDDNGTIWFIAKDIAQVLGYSETSNTKRIFQSVPEIWAEVKRIHLRSENGVEQARDVLCLTEQGLYFFLGRSDKKAALPYQMWVAGEVVPDIRKHGFYATPATVEKILQDPDNFIKVLEAYKNECDKRIALEAKIKKDEPKVKFSEAVESSKGGILVGNFAKLLYKNGINIGQNRLFAWFRENGWLMNTWDSRRNTPTQHALKSGYFTIRESVYHTKAGTRIAPPPPLITGLGQQYFMMGFIGGLFEVK